MATSLIQLLCRTTKLCWFDDDAFRNIVDEAQHFLEKGLQPGMSDYYFLGLKILNMLVLFCPSCQLALTQIISKTWPA